MRNELPDPIWKWMSLLFKSHPWHGVSIGENAPERVTAYIEIVPTDTIKYEIDKISGYLQVDRPQKFSNICPALYGLLPQTYCGELVAELSAARTGRAGLQGDGDPLDICVLSEKTIPRGDILLEAIPVGGLRMLDGEEADDKIIAVLKDDAVYGRMTEIEQCAPILIERLKHYFLTYKQVPGEQKQTCEITHVYGCAEAREVIQRSMADYRNRFGKLEETLTHLLRNES